MIQNYLQVTCGDFNGDGVDEVAVYVPDQSDPRVEVYSLQINDTFTEDNASSYFLNTSNWAKTWVYHLKETCQNKDCVPNMVSLTSGDFDRDGVDDLSVTWGTFYSYKHFSGETASQNIILCGASVSKGGTMFQKSMNLDLSYNDTAIIRAAVSYGDIDGDGVSELVVGGNLESDAYNEDSNIDKYRYAAVYVYDGTGFSKTTEKNFNLFSKTKDSSGKDVYVYPAMARSDERLYSFGKMMTNISAFNMEGVGNPSEIYLDSLILQYGDAGLNILATLDNNGSFNSHLNPSTGAHLFYNEYGAASADLTGATTQTIQTRLCYSTSYGADYSIPEYSLNAEAEGSLTENKDAATGETTYDFSVSAMTQQVDFAFSFCMLNTDNDTSFLNYTGEHGVVYSDPKVLAVLASAPYFKDLARDDLSKSYMLSSTEYKSSTGDGTEHFSTSSIKAGLYISAEQEIKCPLGGTKDELEIALEGEMTEETSKLSETETSVSFETDAGQDSVAFYSIPTEYYHYSCYLPQTDADGNVTGYDEKTISVNIPHKAATVMLSLEQYEKIEASYPTQLPQIAGTVLTSTPGEPSTYPSDTAGYTNEAAYKDYEGVGYGDASITQEIETSSETSSSTEWAVSAEFKIGCGVVAGSEESNTTEISGIILGTDLGKGEVTFSTDGSSYSGTVYNMPESAQEDGYYFAWKLFTYIYQNGDQKIPVVSYLVTDVTAPPSLPTDFAQSSELSTNHSVGLTWSYPADQAVSGFQLYRYYDFSDGGGSYELAFVPASDIKFVDTDENGKTIRHYQYIDDGLADYTQYDYQIQAVRAAAPPNSIMSAVYTARTKAAKGNPIITLNGVTETQTNTYDPSTGEATGMLSNYSLVVHHDTVSTVSVSVEGDYAQTPRYQWQKLDSEKGWQDISGAISASYLYSKSGIADNGEYRCRANVVYVDPDTGESYYISGYSDPFTVSFEKRAVEVPDGGFTADYTGKSVSLTLKTAQDGQTFAPTGNVTFYIRGSDYSSSRTVTLGKPDTDYTTKATLDLGPTDTDQDGVCTDLPIGVYEITARYQGSQADESLDIAQAVYYVSGNSNGYLLNADSTFTYGDSIIPQLSYIDSSTGQIQCKAETAGVSYKVIHTKYSWKVFSTLIGYTFVNGKWVPSYRKTATLVREDTEMPGFIGDDGTVTARETGDYTLQACVDGTVVASKQITVNPRKITFSFQHAFSGVSGNLSVTQPTGADLELTSGSLVYGDTASSLGFAVHAYNTADKEVTIDPSLAPGLYTLRVGASDTMGADYGNYDITTEAGTYTLTGPKYGMTLVSKQHGEDDIVGTVKITSPMISEDDGTVLNMTTTAVKDTWSHADLFSGGTDIILQAKPDAGFQVKSWTVTTGSKSTTTLTSSNIFVYQTTADDTTITVEYTNACNKLFYQSAAPDSNDGAVAPVGSSIQSGFIVQPGARYTFIATPANGYHFVEWTEIGSVNSNFAGNYDDETGISQTTLTMGSATTILSAVFKRNNYSLKLSDGLQATYSIDSGDGTDSVSGAGTVLIPFGAQVTVAPQAGYMVQGGTWKVNGQTVENASDRYSFMMAADTEISALAYQNSYKVTLSVSQPESTDKNAVTAKENNAVADFSQTQDVPGGSSLSFTAAPAWGYVFDHWEVNGTKASSEETLNIGAVGQAMTVLAVFKDNPSRYTVSLSANNGGTLTYSVHYNETGYSGNAPSDAAAASDVTDVTLYQGDSLFVTAHPSANRMLRIWTVGEDIVQPKDEEDKELTIERVLADMNIRARFTYKALAPVSYAAESGGSIVSATYDGFAFNSQDPIGIGTKVMFIAQPASGMALDHWTINGDIVKNTDNTILAGDSLTIGSLNDAADVKAYFKASSLSGGLNLGEDINLSSEPVNIGFDFSKCTLPSDVQAAYIGASTLPQGSTFYNTAKELIGNQETSDTVENLVLYDLKLFDQNHRVIPSFSGTVTVMIPVPKGMSGDLHVYWYNDANGMVTDMNAVQQDGFLVFTTTHFSYYAVAQLSAVSGSENPSGTDSETISSDTSSDVSANGNPDTGSSNLPILPIAALGACSLGVLTVICKKKSDK